MNFQSIKKARSFYALSCITSPGGKHRGLAGSVAVLIAESLLMFFGIYTTPEPESNPDTKYLNSISIKAVKLRGYLHNCIFYLHYLWMIPVCYALFSLIAILSKSGEDRNSILTNRAILQLVTSSDNSLIFPITAMIFSLIVMRRRLKRGLIDRLGISWKRVVLGITLPIFYPTFLMRDIDRLSQIPRDIQTTRDVVREYKPSKFATSWPILVGIYAQFASPLSNALIGITYVTEGPASIDDPTRYALKWIRPEVFTTALEKYSQYIWLASISFCFLLISLSLLSWKLMHKYSWITRNALFNYA